MKTVFKFILLPLICAMMLIASGHQDDYTCIIKGKTIGVQDSTILLLKAGDDFRFDGVEVPIINNTFEYVADFQYPEALTLMLGKARQRGGRIFVFFTEPEEINLTIYSEEQFEKNTVEGGMINQEYQDYLSEDYAYFAPLVEPLFDSLEFLRNVGRYDSEEAKELYQELKDNPDPENRNIIYNKLTDLRRTGLDVTDEARIIQSKIDSLSIVRTERTLQYIIENQSCVSFYLLYSLINPASLPDIESINLNLISECRENLSKAFPGHPYNSLLTNLLHSYESIKIGGNYVDFKARHPDNEISTLSELVRNKVFILDLWSTWCGPCITQSRTYIPLYEEFKDRGLTIVAVAASQKRKEIELALERENYPWINLIEENRENNIWDKYGLSNSGGMSFLVDKDGKIRAINPTADEAREILVKLLP